MRCLVISPTPTHPQDAGNRQRIHGLVSALRGFGHRVEFAFIRREAVEEEAIEAMRAAWDALHLIPYDRRAERPGLGETFALDDWFPPEVEAAVAEIAASAPYDLVLVEYVFLSRALDLFPPGTLRVLDTHDVFADRHRRLQALGLPVGFFHTTPEEEARGLGRADLVLAIQDDERQLFEEVTEAPVVTLGFMPEVAPLDRRARDGLQIGYLGSGNPLNGHALTRFLEAVEPESLEATVQVAGGASRYAEPARPGLLPVGAVERPADFLAGLDLVVNPHEGGTGLKIKTVEALAHGLPVIGTAEAFLGLGARAPFHAAADAVATAGFVRRWARDPGFRIEVARESAALARRYAREVRRQIAPFRSRAALSALVSRPRALLVTDIPFWRESLGNQARIAAMLRVLRGEMDVDTLFLGRLEPEDIGRASRVLGRRGRLLSSPADAAGRRAGPVPPHARLTGFERGQFDAGHFAALEAVLEERGHQLLILEYIRLSYLRHARPTPPLRVLDTHDVMSLRTRNFEHFGREHFIRLSVLEELGIMSGFEAVLAIQESEQALLDGALPGRSILLPHTVAELPAPRIARKVRRIAFIGGDSPMNRDGLRWFIDQVWPAVSDLGAELHVAGRVCDALAGSAVPGLILHGEVDDTADFLDTADIGINPVFYGGGLKIKTVEYLCRGLPSVLTEEGAFGMHGGEGSAYLVARSRAEFVAHLRGLIRDPQRRQILGEGAFRFGRARYAPPASRPACRTLAALALTFHAPSVTREGEAGGMPALPAPTSPEARAA
ncbi:glycosyltransferase [Muricoccus pecuniae]|uniref:Glycosyltransferase involved in cell wall biosynthesis n=1 Tax=Muricoccus pecuniae TaxID=693023 RepID=A0A840XZX5_9PROT|nr:glycosyltransferase [Roseomonas pecuniae]MBB5694015.1 glycosyltransferase involved in cell wall biosynthesis [Roseomonas pecuniae]